MKVPGCGVYEFDPMHRQITSVRIYFDVATLLKQISSHQPQILQELLISWFASRALATKPTFGEGQPYSHDALAIGPILDFLTPEPRFRCFLNRKE